jgi:fatty-acyl-CoA synthase
VTVYLGATAERFPDKLACVIDDGSDSITYADLEARSNAFAHALRRLGLEPGDTVAVMMENRIAFGVAWWAAMRSGLYLTPINWHLTPAEVRYIIGNSGAKVVVNSALTDDVAAASLAEFPDVHRVRVGQGATAALDFDELVAVEPTSRVDRELAGAPMFYSSGTTGRPKGVKPPLPGVAAAEHSTISHLIMQAFGIQPGDRYLSPAPLYHSAPSSWSFGMHTVGATAVIMSHFDPADAVRLLDSQRITVSQWVPTMFQRMLRLADDVRAAYRGDAHRVAYHAAAPCPVAVKHAMIEWWGPILTEFYAATEGGATQIDSHEWLERPGSVGRHWTGGTVHILDLDDRRELSAGHDGLIYFEPFSANRFEYHDDPDKTASVYHDGLVTAGDIGHLDDEGYLYLTDRSSNMIISGGVNIYPMEVENHLASHPAVIDAAVFGIPNDDFGEEVKAVVQVETERVGDVDLVAELHAHCRRELAGFKCPRSIDLVAELPRDDNGKLYKRLLRERYWQGRSSRLV